MFALKILLPISTVLGALTFDLESRPVSQDSVKRDGNTRKGNSVWWANFTFGSEKAQVELPLDIQRSWVNVPSDDSFCYTNTSDTSEQICGPYNFSELSSFLSSFSSDLNTTVYKDLVSFEGFETEVEFTKIDDRSEYFGLGFADSFVNQQLNEKNYTHDGFVQTLKNVGAIDSSVYSFWINPANGSRNGQLVIGGVDESKFNGSLYKLPVANGWLGVDSALVAVRLASLQANDISIAMPVAVSLQPSWDHSLLPRPYIDAILKAYGKRTKKGYVIEQKVLDQNKTIIFNIGDFNLSVPLSSVAGYNQQKQFYLGIYNYSDTYWLGHNVLKHTYISVDLDNKEVALGESLPFTGELKIVNATSGFDGIAIDGGGNETSLAVQMHETVSVGNMGTSTYATPTTYWTGSINQGASHSNPIMSIISLILGIFLI